MEIKLTAENLDGIYPPLVTPFDNKDDVDCELFSIIEITENPKKFFQKQKIVNFKKSWFYPKKNIDSSLSKKKSLLYNGIFLLSEWT